MIFTCKSCPICGAEGIKKIKVEEKDENTFIVYKCLSCDEEFSSYQAFTDKHNSEMNKANMKSNVQPAVLLSKLKLTPAQEVYHNNIGCILELTCEFGNSTCAGTGIIIPNGFVLTNAHIVLTLDEEKEKILNISDTISGHLNKEKSIHELDFVTADIYRDLAILRFTNQSLQGMNLSECPVETGESIYVIGNSRGEGLCVLDGLVSDQRRTLNGQDYILISAPVTNGSSGSPIFNMLGKMVGIVVSGRKNTVGMNYAIPMDVIMGFIRETEIKEDIHIL